MGSSFALNFDFKDESSSEVGLLLIPLANPAPYILLMLAWMEEKVV
jgi:hypothetical protein